MSSWMPGLFDGPLHVQVSLRLPYDREALAAIEGVSRIHAQDPQSYRKPHLPRMVAQARHQVAPDPAPLEFRQEVESNQFEGVWLAADPLTSHGLAAEFDDLVVCGNRGAIEASSLGVLVPSPEDGLDMRPHRLPVNAAEELEIGLAGRAETNVGCSHSRPLTVFSGLTSSRQALGPHLQSGRR